MTTKEKANTPNITKITKSEEKTEPERINSRQNITSVL